MEPQLSLIHGEKEELTLPISPQDLEFDILPTRLISRKELSRYYGAYRCWKSVWDHAYKELNVEGIKNSDDFTKHDEVNALFYKGQCAGLITFKWVDLQNKVELEDSYFNIWPEGSIDRLRKYGDRIIVATHLTVNFDFRRNAHGISWKDLLIALIIKRLESSTFDAMVAAPRLTRSSEKATYRHGAKPISKEVHYTHTNDTVDLIIWKRGEDLQTKDRVVQELADVTWNARTKDLSSIDDRTEQITWH